MHLPVNRRDFLTTLCALPLRAAFRDAQLSLFPLYTRQEEKPVRRSFVDAAAAALTRVYTVSVHVQAPERFEGRCEAEAILDYLAQRTELTMAVMSTALRAPARAGFWSVGRDVSGIGDLPSDNRDGRAGASSRRMSSAAAPRTS